MFADFLLGAVFGASAFPLAVRGWRRARARQELNARIAEAIEAQRAAETDPASAEARWKIQQERDRARRIMGVYE